MSKTVVFFGSGPVAAESLRKLHKEFNIEAVITKPRAPHHKGSVPVIELSEELELPFFTVSTKQELDSLFSEDKITSKIGVLIDFGIIVSQKVINYFEYGIVNSHFSILPEWRGADPITFAILSGQKSTGVSLMLLVEKMDAGPLIAFEKFEIPKSCDTPQLTEELILLSHRLLCLYLPKYLDNEIEPFDQLKTGRKLSYSRKISSLDSNLDFNKSAEELEREIRAYKGWPGSKMTIGSKNIIIKKAHIINERLPAGTIKVNNKKELIVGTDSKAISIDELRPSGKNTMSIRAFLAGNSQLIS